jgi:hypothetical protein
MKIRLSTIKNFVAALCCSTLLYSCNTDNCVTCEKQLPNSVTTQELCEDGSNVSVRITLIGIISDSTVSNTTVSAYQSVLVGQGYSCK